jgi:Flp pilus assembly protein TadG
MDAMKTIACLSGARRRLRSERGAELVEFALVLPLLLLLIGGIADFAFLFHSMEVTSNAAREGARMATLPGYEVNAYQPVKDRVTSYMDNGGLKGPHTTAVTDITLDLGGGLTAQGVQVQVTYTHTYLWIKPLTTLIGGSFATANTYTVTSRMRKELQAVVAGS